MIEGASLLPLLTSLVVALGGLYLGWLVYRRLPKNGSDPLANALGGVHTVLKNKYYFDEIYHTLFIIPTLWLAETFTSAWVDRGLIDVGRVTLGLGSVIRNFFDLPVINGAGDSLGKGMKLFGFSLKPVQSGRIQQYMLTALVVAVVVFVVIFVR